jgi:hypothetical protein
LEIARADHAAVAHGILVLQRAFQHVADDFHVTMRMHPEPASGRDAVVIDDAQRTETHVRRVMILGKGKAEPAVEPAMIGVAAFFGFSDGHHILHLSL